MADILRTTKLTVAFGGLKANDSVNLAVAPGEFVGLIGPNGAGKTTFIDAVTGFVPLTSGSIEFDGKVIDNRPAHERSRAGLRRTFQSLQLYEDLSVRDNLRVGAYTPPWWSFLTDMLRPSHTNAETEDRIDDALEMMGLADVADAMPTELSHGRRTLVGVARAIAAKPKLLLLDEPAAGLDTTETAKLGRQLRSLPDHGISVLLIDHDMGLILNVCDSVYVLDFGVIIAHGTPAEIRTDPAVMRSYLGESAGEVQARIAGA